MTEKEESITKPTPQPAGRNDFGVKLNTGANLGTMGPDGLKLFGFDLDEPSDYDHKNATLYQVGGNNLQPGKSSQQEPPVNNKSKEVTPAEAMKLYDAGKTVQQGLINVIKGVNVGDYLMPTAIGPILNDNPDGPMGQLLSQVDKITKTGDNEFTLNLKNNQSEAKQSIPEIGGANIHIQNGATVKIDISNADKIIIHLEKVKVGFLGLPAITIKGNEAKILGISIKLYK